MWNTSLLLPGVVLAPVALLAGPQVSLTVLLVLAFAGSAASLFVVLRRWGASISAAVSVCRLSSRSVRDRPAHD
jgi:hypothetical protein